VKRNSLFLTIRAGARNPPLLAVTMLALFSATAWLALWWASHRDRSLSCGTPEARDPYDPAEVRRVAETVLDGPGEAPNTVRRSVEVWAARLGGGEREEVPIPSELEGYVQKVALYAYKVTDEDVEELKARGYSEDAIFEINIAASLGAGLARVEKGLGVLKGEGVRDWECSRRAGHGGSEPQGNSWASRTARRPSSPTDQSSTVDTSSPA
jgi:hypothetical protein